MPRGAFVGRSTISARRVGEWKRMMRIANKLVRLDKQVSAIMMAEARNTEARIKRRIRSQYYDWTPLDQDYQAAKVRAGADPRTLIAWGDYIDAIRMIPMGPGIWGVGVQRNQRNQEGESIAEIGLLHEYGGGNIPPRPFWRKEYREARQNLITALIAAGKASLL